MKSVHSLNRINELMSRFVAQVKGASSMSRTDINKAAETILIPLFKEIYGYTDLKNINYAEDDDNYPGIDLGDETARVTFQITATRTLLKVKHTLRQFIKNEQYKKYDRLVIYILTDKQSSYSAKKIKQIIQNKVNFDTKKDIWDFQDILKEVANFQVDKLQKIERILEDNFGGERQSPNSKINLHVNLQTLLDTAMQRSKARCIARWQGAGVNKNDAIALADDPSIGISPSELQFCSSKLIILTGEMGVGKSLIGDRLFQAAILKAKEDITAPIPIFFEARQLQGKSLEQAIEESVHNLGNSKTESIFAIIDEADEIGITNAVKLLEEARILVQMPQDVTLLLISKPILEFVNAEESIKVPLLSKDTSEALVRRLSGQIYFSSNSLSKPAQDAILRPLFAVLLGTHLRESGVWTLQSKEQLLSSLVERSLRPFRENLTRVSQLLEQLAAACIDRGGKTVPANEIASWFEQQQLLDLRLIIEDGNGLRFPLSILTQWFAAQRLLTDASIIGTLIEDKQRLELWRYPLVIAVATFSLNRVSGLLAPIAKKEPVMAADIVSEALAFQGYSLEVPSLSILELGRQVRMAMQAWMDGFRPLTSFVTPALENGTLPTMGVRISQKQVETDPPTDTQIITAWVEIAWHSGNENLPEVIELPPNIDSDNLSSSGWKSLRGFPPYLLASWVWKWTLEQVISLLLQQRSIPVRAGLLSLEAAWHGASHILRRDHRIPDAISLNEIEACLTGMQEIPCSRMMHHCLRQLEIEMEAAHARKLTHLILPTSFYVFRSCCTVTDGSLLAYAEDVYRGAFEGYLQLVNTLSSKFLPKLQLASILPARIVGVVALPSDSDSVSLSWYWEPLPAGSQNEVDFRLSDYPLPGDDPSVMAAMENWFSLRPQQWMHFRVTCTSSPFTEYWLGANPVTELAYEFLWEDLKKIGWVDGSLGGSGFPYTY